MFWPNWRLTLLLVLTESAPRCSFPHDTLPIKGVYYSPSLIGISPHKEGSASDPYGSWFQTIHQRDIPLMAQVTDTVRLSGIGVQVSSNHTRFLDLAHSYGLRVIFSFSFTKYQLSYASQQREKFEQVVKEVLVDFKSFLISHSSHPAVVMWSLGDIDDDELSPFLTDPVFAGQLSELLGLLLAAVQSLDTAAANGTRMVGISINGLEDSALMKQLRVDYPYTPRRLSNPSSLESSSAPPLSFDCFLLNVDEAAVADLGEGFTREMSNNSVPLLIQFSVSAWSRYQAGEDPQGQATKLSQVMTLLQRTKQSKMDLSSIILHEWADQWWRGQTADCAWGRPYYHSTCGDIVRSRRIRGEGFHIVTTQPQYHGLHELVDKFGDHCIRPRPALAVFNTTFQSYSPSKVRLGFAPFQASILQCAAVYPGFFEPAFENPWVWAGLVPFLTFFLINFVLWVLWRKKRTLPTTTGMKASPSSVKHSKLKRGGEGEPLLNQNSPSTRRQDTESLALNQSRYGKDDEISSDVVYAKHAPCGFRLYTKKLSNRPDLSFVPLPLPDKKKKLPPDDNNNAGPEHQLQVAGLLTFYLQEHLTRQEQNLDEMLKHEEQVQSTLVDYRVKPLNPAESVEARRLLVVHERFLEGYNCWREKQSKMGKNLPKRAKQSNSQRHREALLYRLLLALSEHVIHCPERIAYVFHHIAVIKSPNIDPKSPNGNARNVMPANSIKGKGKDKSKDRGGKKGAKVVPFEEDEEKEEERGEPEDVERVVYDIDMDFLLDGLSQIHKGSYNFDDLNDCGILATNKIKKTWHESRTYAVFFDLLRNYNSLIFVKLWLFALALSLSSDVAYLRTVNFWVDAMRADSIMYIISEIILLFYAFYQTRTIPNISGIVAATICAILGLVNLFLQLEMKVWVLSLNAANAALYFLFRVFLTIFISPLLIQKALCLKRDNLYPTQMYGRRLVSSSGKKREFFRKLEPYLFWFIIAGLTFVVEYQLVVPVVGDMSFARVCTVQCPPDGLAFNFSSTCFACQGAVLAAYALMVVTVFVDTPVIFYSMVSIVGYIKGQGRKVQNVYARELCKVDLRSKGAQKEHLTQVFGDWETCAYLVWVDLVTALHQRDLICKEDMLKLRSPGKCYDFSEINAEARERLCFFLRTIASMAKMSKETRAKEKAKVAAIRRKGGSSGNVVTLYETKPADPLLMGDYFKRRSGGPNEGFESINSPALEEVALRQVGSENAFMDREESVEGRVYSVELTEHQRQENFLRMIPRVSQIITCLDEVVSLSRQYLQLRNGARTNLEHLIALSDYKKEWEHFCERFRGEYHIAKKWNILSHFLNYRPEGEKVNLLDPNAEAWEEKDPAERDREALRLHTMATSHERRATIDTQIDAEIDKASVTEVLTTLRSEFGEWRKFRIQQHRQLEKLDIELSHLRTRSRKESVNSADSKDKDEELGDLDEERVMPILVEQVREWASFRAQTVSRTVRGALTYHDSILKRLTRFQTKSERTHSLPSLADFTQLILACQTYATYPDAGTKQAVMRDWKDRRDDVDDLVEKYKAYPILLVYDYKPPPPLEERKSPIDRAIEGEETPEEKQKKKDFDYQWQEICLPYWEKDEEEMMNFLQTRAKEYGIEPPSLQTLKFATCVKQIVNGKLVLTSVMPRMYPLRLGKEKSLLTNGKSGNQNNALRLVSGHVIQVCDANMDGWIGEGYKLPFVTRLFLDGDPETLHFTEMGKPDRRNLLFRIIGFREYIFTGPQGHVAQAMASSEFAFGTIFQRVLADPLGVRMHYGHPDFFDGFWALNRGGLSKASAKLNLSEDIFAGYNVLNRQEQIAHVDFLEWQKGRETTLTAAAGFIIKISSGAVAMLRTRDLSHMQTGMGFTKKLSLYYGGVGSYIFQLAVDYSIIFYVLFFVLSSIGNITLSDIGLTGSSLGAEWLISFGFASSLPLLTELMLEHGWGHGVLELFKWFLSSAIFFLFQNKTIAATLRESFRTGEAVYVATGRPNAFDHYSLKKAYLMFANSHYHPAMRIVYFYILYRALVDQQGGAMPMFLVLGTSFAWILAPVIFCPQKDELEVMWSDVIQCYGFIFSAKTKEDSAAGEESMDKMMREQEQKDQALSMFFPRAFAWLFTLVQFIALLCVSFSNAVDVCVMYLSVWAIHTAITFTWSLSNYSNVMCGIWMMFPLLGILTVPSFTPFDQFGPESLLGVSMLLLGMRLATHALLLFLSIVIAILNMAGVKGGDAFYKRAVDRLYYLSLSYHMHLYSGVVVITAQYIFQLVCVVAIRLWRLLLVTVCQDRQSRHITATRGLVQEL